MLWWAFCSSLLNAHVYVCSRIMGIAGEAGHLEICSAQFDKAALLLGYCLARVIVKG